MCPGNSRNRTHSISPKTRITVRETRWWESRWTWSTSLSTDASGRHLQTQILQNTFWEWAGVLTTRKEYTEPRRTQQNEGRRGKRGGWDGLDLHLVRGPGGGLLNAGVRSPHRGNCLGQTRSIWECWRVQRLLCDRLNGMRITWTIPAAALPTQDRDTSLLGAGA